MYALSFHFQVEKRVLSGEIVKSAVGEFSWKVFGGVEVVG